ncbi:hypothetical protein K504DRAFT_472454 [Pleomassaria siparia CBS 279.74]|uniref:BAG domain-containing protein n=1 Tax=Pleomassaria siparia CBS 279.74 TaxID=1314801 RepID=A0A6G1KKC0_9PLEO|nr:hypothetical protein K504DRAFT_472454 [Pleomassaria siparia CBS 279.74]
MPTWGRGGAGNILSDAQVQEQSKKVAEDLEANRSLTSSAAPPTTSTPSTSTQDYAHMGRGGAGNWYEPKELLKEGTFSQPSDSTALPTTSKPLISTPWHPDSQELPVARSGRGGAGNFVWKDEERERSRREEMEKAKERVSEETDHPPPSPRVISRPLDHPDHHGHYDHPYPRLSPQSRHHGAALCSPSEEASQLPQSSSTFTPVKKQPSTSKLASWTVSTTPKNRTPIKAPTTEMHPAYHHASTAKVLDEARWLGFQAMDAHTTGIKATGAAMAPGTPSKTPVPTSTSRISNFLASPDFRFRFASPTAELTPKSGRISNEDHENDTVAGGRAIFGADEFSSPADVATQQRKTAAAKGKMARFSGVHMQQFKKMDSIANHPSAFRADPNRFKSKMDLAESASKAPAAGLKRTQSKMDLAESASKASATALKRTQSKMDLAAPASAPATKIIPPTPLKRTQSKMDMAPPNSSLPRASSTVRLVPPSRDGRPTTQDASSAKRFKRIETDDAASTRPVSRDDTVQGQKPATPRRAPYSQNGLPRLASRLLTPTRASLARSQSVKAPKSTAMASSLLRSPSTHTLFSPTNIGQTMKNGMREGIRKTSSSLQKVRSILRTPGRKYSNDMAKVASGTHMSPPPGLDLDSTFPKAPATVPAKKHVNFSNSTLERIAHDELGKSPSPTKLRAGSEVPSGAVIYPTLQTSAEYPALPNGDEMTSPSRRLTFGGMASNTPGKFLFKSDKSITFSPVAPGSSISVARKSNASSLFDDKKRKLDTLDESSDKENSKPVDEDGRSAKKMRTTPAEPPKTPSSVSKLPRRTPNRGSAMSKSTFTVASLNTLLDDFKKSFVFFKNHPLFGTTSTPPPTTSESTDFLSQLHFQALSFLHSTGIAEFFQAPRFDDPTYITTLAILLAAVFVTMSWFSRSGNGGGWGGRFSPFGRPGASPNNGEVSDADFSYITSEDLAHATGGKDKERHRSGSRTAAPEIVDWEDKNPNRQTDVLVFKQGRTNYPTHFPVQSIQDGDLTIGTVRQAAAKKVGISDPRRIRMFFKGRNLKHDNHTAREEGLRGDGTGSEILVVTGEANSGGMAPGSEDSGAQGAYDDSDDDDTEDANDSGANAGGKKKSRKRGGKKNKKKPAAESNAPGYSNSNAAGPEYLPIPSYVPNPRPTSSSANIPRAATPQTPLGKLDALASKFHIEFVPLAVQFMASPPEDSAKRSMEYKKLSESILTQVLMKLDGVETEGDQDARARRKELVKEVQGMLNKLDEYAK